MGLIKKLLFLPLFLLFIGGFFAPKANAALINVSDNLSTSRPSAASTIIDNQTGPNTVGQVKIFDNGSMFLVSDSAIFSSDKVTQTQDVTTVASMSAQQAGPSRYVYFTGLIPHVHHAGTALITNITATHTITLTPGVTIPNSGKIVITFPNPGAGNNVASPSASGFSFNGESATPTDITCYDATVTSGQTCKGTDGAFASDQL